MLLLCTYFSKPKLALSSRFNWPQYEPDIRHIHILKANQKSHDPKMLHDFKVDDCKLWREIRDQEYHIDVYKGHIVSSGNIIYLGTLNYTEMHLNFQVLNCI